VRQQIDQHIVGVNVEEVEAGSPEDLLTLVAGREADGFDGFDAEWLDNGLHRGMMGCTPRLRAEGSCPRRTLRRPSLLGRSWLDWTRLAGICRACSSTRSFALLSAAFGSPTGPTIDWPRRGLR